MISGYLLDPLYLARLMADEMSTKKPTVAWSILSTKYLFEQSKLRVKTG
jgi:hypothetical protein